MSSRRTGDALQYLPAFHEYWGFDVDPVTLPRAFKRYAGKQGVRFEARLLDANAIASTTPTRVVQAGLLHHLTNEEVSDLFRLLASGVSIRRIVTQDIVYLPNERVSNLYAKLDRGCYCREPAGYERLVEASGFKAARSEIIRWHPTRGRVKHFIMVVDGGA